MNKNCKQYVLFFLLGMAVLLSAVANAAQDTPSTIIEPGDSTYLGIYEHPITLKDGHWQGAPFSVEGASRPRVGLVEDFCLTGDLDGDGEMERIVFL